MTIAAQALDPGTLTVGPITNPAACLAPSQARRRIAIGKPTAVADRSQPGSSSSLLMTIADDHLEQAGAELDAWDRADAVELLELERSMPGPVRGELQARHGTRPVMGLVVRLATGQVPGAELQEDARWCASTALARRQVLAYWAGGAGHEHTEANLALLDHLDSCIGDWPQPEWEVALTDCVDGLVTARRRGRERRVQLSHGSDPSWQPRGGPTDWLLRHPSDHYFRRASAATPDSWLRDHLDNRVRALSGPYAALAGHSSKRHGLDAEVIAEIEVLADSSPRFDEPVPTVVSTSRTGPLQPGTKLPVRQVEDPAAPFNGTLISLTKGERWLIYGSLTSDGAVATATARGG